VNGEPSVPVLIKARLFKRPEIDEPCPQWAHALLVTQEEQLGVSQEQIPRETLEELSYFFPLPEPAKRTRESDTQKRLYKPYLRTSGLAVFLACLPIAQAKQLDLFANVQDGVPNEVAVLNIRKMADLAGQVGISYDRLNRWMTLLITLGFIWRFRLGRQSLYVIPLVAYFPPSATAVQEKLNGLIHSQFVEVRMADGTTVCQDRNPSFTKLLLEVKTRFEIRYNLAPSDFPQELTNPRLAKLLTELRCRLPHLSSSDLSTILSVVLKHNQEETLRTEKQPVIESTLSEEHPRFANQEEEKSDLVQETPPDALVQPDINLCQASPLSDGSTPSIELDKSSIKAGTNLRQTVPESTPVSRRNIQRGETVETTPRIEAKEEKEQPRFVNREEEKSNLMKETRPDALEPTAVSRRNIQRGETVETTPRPDVKEEKERKCRELGTELARIFGDSQSVNYYIGVHRTTDPRLLRAIYIKTLCQEQNGGFRRSIGAYFKFMHDTWSPLRTYSAACAKWNHWGNKRDPKGIPPNIQRLVETYEQQSYTEISISMGHDIPEEQMTQAAALHLKEEITRNASWYFQDPQVRSSSESHSACYVVEVRWKKNGSYQQLTSFNDWMDIHQGMLTLPDEINAWFEAERVVQLEKNTNIYENGEISVEIRERCVKAALAMFTYYEWDVSSFSWKELLVLGKPLVFPQKTSNTGVEEEILSPALARPRTQINDLYLEGNQLYVRLDDELVPFDYYQYIYERLESVQKEEEMATTYNGALVALLSEQFLGLDASALRKRLGQAAYQSLVSGFLQESYSDKIVSVKLGSVQLTNPTEKTRGMDFETLCQSLGQLQSAFDPRLYHLRWKMTVLGTFCILLFSQPSGQIYIFSQFSQVEQVLLDIKLQEEELTASL
jgi:hypothetical protein